MDFQLVFTGFPVGFHWLSLNFNRISVRLDGKPVKTKCKSGFRQTSTGNTLMSVQSFFALGGASIKYICLLVLFLWGKS